MEFETGFGINMGKGFLLVFEHGTRISVQWGAGNYCSNKSTDVGAFPPRIQENYHSRSAEILIEDVNGKELTKKFDKEKCRDGFVIGWVNPEYVAKAIAWTVKYDKKYGKKLAFIENCMTCDHIFPIDNVHYCGKGYLPLVAINKLRTCPLDEKEDK